MKNLLKKLFTPKSSQTSNKVEDMSVTQLLLQMEKSVDFLRFTNQTNDGSRKVWINYYYTLVDTDFLHRDILHRISTSSWSNLQELKNILPIEVVTISSDPKEIREKLLTGFIFVQVGEKDKKGLLVRSEFVQTRAVSLPEVEFSVIGPKESFVENIDSNINLIRRRLSTPMLTVEQKMLGTISRTRIAVMSLDGIADRDNVQTVTQRLDEVEFDHINDSSYITQLISDNGNSIFPLLLDTERPDRIVSALTEGKVVIMVDGSPHGLIGPTTLVEFFSSFEDYYLSYWLSSFFRLIRLFGVAFSILVTPVYVAVLSYHYELIPKDLLSTLISSRREVPLPPILEAIFLELTIELLREAGARLPTKVGQTIGIVGGIVIGTASVEAGLTSNVLLIIVALAALASFTTPVYKMGNTIRLLRFPFLLFAELWGLLGIVFCFCILAAHLLRLTSLGRPYLEPIYPPRVKDMKDALLRLPFSMQTERPGQLRTNKPHRMAKTRKKPKKDIDE
ncbi:spore germination protein [Sutcliffiella horikoshii]|uniref:spore germination protein n=1 Tax=Sutcliffiella horikoshii TaxID=79883 RepID=UPI001CBDE487|nr:spore germination protein [Sutcliffiella horikoshii]UAL48815.1 spore germination protein [Sutcliffiella horikoshii]